MLRALGVIVCAASLCGCYYMQAARGQLDVMSKREPIDELIADDETPDELAEKLELVSDARQFAVDVLYLPDNGSYTSYADIGRDYVVWNVFAAPEFSLEPKTWCFPIAGCVAYRGYFSEESARQKAAELSAQGYDVAVGGVPAYSTLGRFDDPVLNTMMRWDDTDLVATIFHELAHQVLYVKGDTEFNESFATAVAEIGLELWLESRDESAAFEAYRDRRDLRDRIGKLVLDARAELEALYRTRIATELMRERKMRRLEQLRGAIKEELERSGRTGPAWTDEAINNARLVSIGLYLGRVEEFRDLYEACGQDLACVYERASSLQPAEASAQR